MPKFAANLSFLFTEVPFLDRFEAAAKAGFKAVEYLDPFVAPAAELKSRLEANGLTQALFNMAHGDWAKGEQVKIIILVNNLSQYHHFSAALI